MPSTERREILLTRALSLMSCGKPLVQHKRKGRHSSSGRQPTLALPLALPLIISLAPSLQVALILLLTNTVPEAEPGPDNEPEPVPEHET